jgi:hypothetical protein
MLFRRAALEKYSFVVVFITDGEYYFSTLADIIAHSERHIHIYVRAKLLKLRIHPLLWLASAISLSIHRTSPPL